MPGSGDTSRVLQIGCGAFGETHLAAWRRLGHRERVVVADPFPTVRKPWRSALDGRFGPIA